MTAAAHLHRLREALNGPTTLGELAVRLGREGAGLLVLVSALPFLQPIPLAGLGTPVGIMLIAVGVQLSLGHEIPALPKFVARRRLEAATVQRILSAAERALRAVEWIVRPRWPVVARSPRLIGLAIIVLGLIFAIPVFIPFGNPLTAAPLALLGLTLLEDDGVLGTLGLAGTAVAVVYHAAFAQLIWTTAHAFAEKMF